MNKAAIRLRDVLFSRFVVLLLLIMFLVEFVKGALLVAVLPVYFSSVLGLSVFAVGWAMSLQYIGDNVGRTPTGWLVDKAGYRLTMLLGVVATFGAVAIFALFDDIVWMVAASALLGLGTSPLWPCVMAGATGVAGEKARATVMSVIYTSWLVGTGMGPVVINFFIYGHDYTQAFRILIGMMTVVVLAALFLPKRETAADAGKSSSAARLPLFKPAIVQRHQDPGAEGAKASGRKEGFLELAKSLQVSFWFYPALFLQTFALGILTPIITLYAREVLQLSPQQYSLFLLFGGAITVGALIPVGKLVDRYGHRSFLHVGLPLAAAAMLAFPFAGMGVWLYAAVALIGLGYALIIPSWNAMIASVVPNRKRGTVWGFILTIEGAGMITGPIVSGKLWDVFGPAMPFLVSGSVLAVLVVLHGMISHNKKVVVR
ncbi:MFS transporter [Paenibacillus turpanensis]|uniref:MFS transporter n=1 Tax=Paenibacillus turpanensis TaxID=2689078 RepID=UPI001FB7A148|nr:MFS transporter [Paenibacillus turpanensis]